MLTGEDRLAWLIERRKGIGASDAASIMGVGKWGTALSVWLDKTSDEPPKEESEETQFQRGNFFEPVCARLYANKTGEDLYKPAPILWHDDLDWMYASLDYRRKSDHRPIECKTTRTMEEFGEPDSDQVPAYYAIQAQQQMEVADQPFVDFSVLCGFDHFIYTVKRNYEIAAMIIEVGGQFWENVKSRIQPDIDWAHKTTPELMKTLYQKVKRRTITLGGEAVLLHDQYEQLKLEEKTAKEAKELIHAKMKALMGEADVAELSDGSKWTRAEIKNPGYTVAPFTYITLTPRRSKAQKANGGQ